MPYRLSEEKIDRISKYAVGHGTLVGCPHINHERLKEKGFTTEVIKKIDSVALKVYNDLEKTEIPSIQLPTRSKSNIEFNEKHIF